MLINNFMSMEVEDKIYAQLSRINQIYDAIE